MTILSIESLTWKSMNVRDMNWTIVLEIKELSINNISERHVSINIQRRLFVITRSKRFVAQTRVIFFNFRSDVLLNKNVTYLWRDHRLKFICRIRCRLFRQNQINSLFIKFFMIVIIMSREKIWQKIVVDYWSNERIQRDLNIDETMYKKINVVKLNIEIAIYTLVDDKINNVIVKTLLQLIFDWLIERFENVFRDVSKTWIEACLVHWAQKCNNNKKKRKRDDFFSILKSQEFFFQFDQIIINCKRRKKIINMRCKMRELINIDISFANITMNDLKFELFIEMLKKNLKFDFVTEIIYYKLRDNKKLWCSSIRFWKIVLFEMYCLNLICISFTIDLFSENTMQTLSDIWNHY